MLLLFVAFIVVPLAELYVIIKVGGLIGVFPTIVLLLGDSLLGAALLRSQGRAAWVAFNRALAEGRAPGKEATDGAMVIFGGALLLTPGFLTDIAGMLLLLPPSRALIRRAGARSLRKRAASDSGAIFGWTTRSGARTPTGGPAGAGDQGSRGGAGSFDPGNPFGDPRRGGNPFGGQSRGPSPRSGRAASDPFSDLFSGPSPFNVPRSSRRPGDIEGTATEVGDDANALEGSSDQEDPAGEERA